MCRFFLSFSSVGFFRKKMHRNGLARTLRKEQVEVERDGFIVCTDETNVTLWKVGLTDDMLELYGLHDLRLEVEQWALEKNKPALVTLEFRFPLSYPSLPPFVRIITPRFAFHTGHITVGGSVCAEFLTTTGWKPSEMNMNYILRSLCGLLYAGQAKLEHSFKQSEYSLSEAQEAFQRVASQHGWKF